MKPPSIWSVLLAFVTTLWVLDDLSRQVASHPNMILLAPVVAFILFVNYLGRVMRPRESAQRVGVSESGGSWRWFVLPLCTVVVFSAVPTYWPMHLRFALSKSAFEQKAQELLHGEAEEEGPQRVGWYWIKSIQKPGEGTVGFVTGESIADPVAITYNPANPPSHTYRFQICENWYAEEW
jgi:hypothetical protein